MYFIIFVNKDMLIEIEEYDYDMKILHRVSYHMVSEKVYKSIVMIDDLSQKDFFFNLSIKINVKDEHIDRFKIFNKNGVFNDHNILGKIQDASLDMLRFEEDITYDDSMIPYEIKDNLNAINPMIYLEHFSEIKDYGLQEIYDFLGRYEKWKYYRLLILGYNDKNSILNLLPFDIIKEIAFMI